MDKLIIKGHGHKNDTYVFDSDGKPIKGLHVEKIEVVIDANRDSTPMCKLTLVPGTVDLDLEVQVDGIQMDILSDFANKLFLIQDSLHGKSLDSVQNEIYEVQRQLEIIVRNSHHSKAPILGNLTPKSTIENCTLKDGKLTGDMSVYFEDSDAISEYLEALLKGHGELCEIRKDPDALCNCGKPVSEENKELLEDIKVVGVPEILKARQLLDEQPFDMKNRMAYCFNCDSTHQITDTNGIHLSVPTPACYFNSDVQSKYDDNTICKECGVDNNISIFSDACPHNNLDHPRIDNEHAKELIEEDPDPSTMKGGVIKNPKPAIMGEQGSETIYQCSVCDVILHGEGAVKMHRVNCASDVERIYAELPDGHPVAVANIEYKCVKCTALLPSKNASCGCSIESEGDF